MKGYSRILVNGLAGAILVASQVTDFSAAAVQAKAPVASNKESKELKKDLDNAQALLEASQKDLAEKLLKEIVAKNPDSPRAKLLHARALYDQGRLHAAQDDLEVLVNKEDSPLDAWLYLARTYQKIGKLEPAIATYNLYLEKAPKNFEDKDKYKTLIMLLENQLKEESQSSKQAAKRRKGNYLGDVTENGIFRWPANRMPIKVYIKNGENVPGYRYDFDESIRDAFDQWQIKTNGLIKFILVNSPEEAKFTVTWTNDLKSKPFHAELGHARLSSDGEGIERADLELLTINPFKGEGPVGKRLMRNVCLHEVGHALGLQGHSPHKDDIMFPQLSVQDGISDRDLNTLLAIYADDAREKILSAKPTIRQHSSSRQAAILSNEGARLAMAGKYQEAYDLLKKAVKINPEQKLVRQNLGAVTNNLAIKEEDPRKALRLIHESLYYDERDSARSNLDIFLQRVNIRSEVFEDRIKLSDQCLKKGDKIGALIELKEALKIKDDPETRKKMAALETEISSSAADPAPAPAKSQ